MARGEGRGEGQGHTSTAEYGVAPHPSPLPASGERERALRKVRVSGVDARHVVAGRQLRVAGTPFLHSSVISGQRGWNTQPAAG